LDVEPRPWANLPLGLAIGAFSVVALDFPSPFSLFALVMGIALAATVAAPDRPTLRLRGRVLSWRDAAHPAGRAFLAGLLAVAGVANAVRGEWVAGAEAGVFAGIVGAFAAWVFQRVMSA
jgi:hypothetical protein